MNLIDRIGKRIGDARLEYLRFYAPSWSRDLDLAPRAGPPEAAPAEAPRVEARRHRESERLRRAA